MGPHVFACGNLPGPVADDGGRTASMGPHVFACGNWGCRLPVGPGEALQWGRTFLRAEIATGSPPSRRSWRFNGAARFCVRKSEVNLAREARQAASMGPHVFACGNGRPRHRARHGSHASMGPHVFACGNFRIMINREETQRLQWGRTFLRAEI